MALIKTILSLINIGAWIEEPISGTFLLIDGMIYNLVSYAFRIFMTICNINFQSIGTIIQPLIDRLKAVILVFILFKVGIALITYLMEPIISRYLSYLLVKKIECIENEHNS